jgi:uncharacterized membrane protein
MELAFINSILRSATFPPSDPWLSGFAISYYYFGYVMVAMLAQLAGVTAGVAFNLMVALIFSLGALGAYGLVYNLLSYRSGSSAKPREEDGRGNPEDSEETIHRNAWWSALLGPFFVLLIGNVEGFLELLHARGVFWRVNQAGELTSRFWTWLDMQELSQPPVQPLQWLPRNFGTGSWWWWRASRVIQDYDLSGNWREVIDEFPFFSFLLADLHPHVLAIPFALFGIALALNIYLGGAEGEFRFFRFRFRINRWAFILAALLFGGLSFLNTWDFPMYVALFSGAYVLMRARQEGWGWGRLRDFFGVGLALGVSGFLLYLPFYLGFSSQAGGILPNLIYPTRGAHLWVMFGLFFLPMFTYLGYVWRREGNFWRMRRAFQTTWVIFLGLFLFAIVLGALITSLPLLEGIGLLGLGGFDFTELRNLFLSTVGAGDQVGALFQEALLRRLRGPGGWLTLGVLFALILGLLWPIKRKNGGVETGEVDKKPQSKKFALLLMLFATLLVIGPEFFYLRDQFGWRINTIFKFYYQAWLLWGVAVAYAVVVLLHARERIWRVSFASGFFAVVLAGLAYPAYGLWDKTNGFRPQSGLTLDGTSQGFYLSAEDQAAVQWLQEAPVGVVSEAIGGSYTQYARISAHTGQPTVLGWPGHESQWRGGAEEMGTRQRDIEQLYSTRSWDEARRVIDLYSIQYVYVGPLERSTYGLNEGKFQRFMIPAFQQGPVTIYELQ